MPRTDFVERSPLTRDALAFANERHAGQTRDLDGLPFVTHPLEVACLLHDAGYADEVVAAGVLHDVLEDINADHAELAHPNPRTASAMLAHLGPGLSSAWFFSSPEGKRGLCGDAR